MPAVPVGPLEPEPLLEALSDLPPATAYRVGFSGGLDSSVLLQSLVEVRDRLAVPLRAVHVNHGLHGDAARWAEHCLGVCERAGVPCQVVAVDARPGAGQSPEAAARRARYRAFADLLAPGEGLLTAHHLDDQAETVLLHLLRGAGPAGLSGMPAVRPLGAGWLGRPLLVWPRAALRAFAEARGIEWLEDPSNRDPRYRRNFLRGAVMPLLRERWPGLVPVLARVARHQADLLRRLDQQAAEDLESVTGVLPGTVSAAALGRLPVERQRATLRAWIHGLGLPGPSAGHVEQVLREVVAAPPDAVPCVRWLGAEVRRYRDTLLAREPLPAVAPGAEWAWTLTRALSLPGGVLRAEPATGQGLAARRLATGGVTVRPRRGGERCRLPGRDHSHALKKLLQARGVPTWGREHLPLVYVDGELAAVADLWVCAPFAAGAGESGWVLRWEPAPALVPTGALRGQ